MDKINEIASLKAIGIQAKRDAGLPIQNAEEFAKTAALEVLGVLNSKVQTELDVEADDFKSMGDDDVTAMAVLEGVGIRIMALMEANGGYKPSEQEATDDDDELAALASVTRGHAGMRRSKIKG